MAKLRAAVVLSVLCAAASCSRSHGGDDDDVVTDGDADSDSDSDGDSDGDADADPDLQVQFHYTTFCQDGGCATVDHELDGKNGDVLPNLSSAVLGVECEIVSSTSAKVLASLRVQDRSLSTLSPSNGIAVHNGQITVGSRMSCLADGFALFDDRNEFDGTCGALQDGSCDMLVDEYDEQYGRLVLRVDCLNLAPVAGNVSRSIRDALLTIQGCTVMVDAR